MRVGCVGCCERREGEEAARRPSVRLSVLHEVEALSRLSDKRPSIDGPRCTRDAMGSRHGAGSPRRRILVIANPRVLITAFGEKTALSA